MDDKVTPSTETAEYNYNEAEAGSVASDAAAEGQAADSSGGVQTTENKHFGFNLQNLNLKRFLRPGLIMLGIVLVYVGFNFYSSKKSKDLEQKKISMQESAALVQQQQVAIESAPTKQPEIRLNLGSDTAASSIGNDQVAQAQGAMQKKLEVVVEQFASGQERISSISESVAKTEQDIASISQRIDQLAVTMQQISADIEKMKKPKVVKKAYKLPVAYHVRAIVPGRVWLESADGQRITLRVGDKLDGYGEVRVIAPRQGMVVMSNGSVIQYGVNDF